MAEVNGENSIWVRTTKTTESSTFLKTSLQMLAMNILHIFYKYVICSVYVLYEKKMEDQKNNLGSLSGIGKKNIFFDIGNGAKFRPKIR